MTKPRDYGVKFRPTSSTHSGAWWFVGERGIATRLKVHALRWKDRTTAEVSITEMQGDEHNADKEFKVVRL